MNARILAIAAGFGLAMTGWSSGAMAAVDDCGSPRTINYCGNSASCGAMYVPYFKAHQDKPNLQQMAIRGPVNVALELPPISARHPESVCLAYLLPTGTYDVEATFADGATGRRGNVEVRQLHTTVTCPEVSVNLTRKEVTQNPILCRGLSRTGG